MTISASILTFLLLALSLSNKELKDLAQALKEGDKKAFKTIFEAYHNSLFRFLMSRGVDYSHAQDILQQTFLKVWEKRTDLDPEKSLRSFLFTIAYNLAKNHFRQAGFERLESISEPSAEDEAPAEEEKDLNKLLRLAVDDLPERRRAVFELCFFEGLTYKEVGGVLEISPKTVGHHMSAALSTLRETLKDFLPKD